MQLVLSSSILRGLFLDPELLGIADYFCVLYLADRLAILEVGNRFAFAGSYWLCVLRLAEIT